jgi:hypothetical protein
MRLGTWNVTSLYRAGSLVTVSKELPNYRLDLLADGRAVAPNQQKMHIFLWKGK